MSIEKHTTATLPTLLTYRQAGEVLAVTDRTVRNLVNNGRLIAVRVTADAPRIDPADLQTFIQQVKGGR